jgi:hypothetical protein
MGIAADRKDDLVLAALLANPTIKAASQACGVSERQIRVRLGQPAFKKKYDTARRELLEQTTAYVQGALTEAIDKLLSIMRDPDASPQTQVNAASALVRTFLKLNENCYILNQIEEIKKAVFIDE